ncbi:quinone oxidoreductase family protein [Luteimonas kalidii]|uniref:NADP-dependent oxidoreductase n=1 Tax=Luteimonas kalidii TaxID=3042025 RepID=A0ABT6JPH3_9GAMM|nr:NADP-dependent oxidoreductase [Luteimonas kalidii]MDH5832586.1 NADP-dependent oxidoreductase [Luteimonas kalidii]
MPIPTPGPGQVLVRLHAAGVGRWDLLERDGAFARGPARWPSFPHVGGSEGAGVVVSMGAGAAGLREGDRVYGVVPQRTPKQGCHAEFTLFEADLCWPVPPRLSMDQAAVLPVDGALAWQGLHEALQARRGDALVVFGASGGVGHFALQFATNLGLRTLAVASGTDGMQLADRLGAEAAIDGRRRGFEREVARFADGRGVLALLTAGGQAAARLLAVLPAGSRAVWPHGVEMEARPGADVHAAGFGPRYRPDAMRAFHAAARHGPLMPHVSRRLPLQRLPQALDMVARHHLGRLAVLSA